MPISYAGVNLLLEDPGGEVQKWVDRYLPLDDLRLIGAWPTAVWNKAGGLPLPNYSRPLAPKINTWYRPVGASRWSFGLFLASGAQKTQILNAIGPYNSSQSLRIEHAGNGRSWVAYMLPPRAVSAKATGDDALWIIPLVDERYYWQFVSAGQVSVTDASTWSGLLTSLGASLGMSQLTVDTVPEAFGSPNMVRFNQASYQNAAVMLDAAAHSVGQRIFLKYERVGDNSYYSKWYQSGDFRTSDARRALSLSLPVTGSLQAGAVSAAGLNLSAILPETIQVVFRKWANGIVWDNEYYTSSVNLTSQFTDLKGMSGYTKTIHTTALADHGSGSGTPDNASDCDALAVQIAIATWGHLRWVQDSIFLGSHDWVESGHDDYVEFSLGNQLADGSYACHTRVHSLPYNFGVEEGLHQLEDTYEYGDFLEGTLDETLSAHGTATMNVFEGDPAADSGRDVTATDRDGYDGTAGTTLAVHRVNKIWRIVSIACGPS